jgi:mannose-6-phosphate isomerase
MNELYPLKFRPVFKDKIWGGQKIHTQLGMDFSPLPNCGEAWLLSGVDNNATVVANGFLEGNELNELVEVYMGDLVGDDVYAKYGDQFPILVKLLDTTDYLSVQVHPGDELARRRHRTNAKAEMWYVMDADPGASLFNGFSKRIDAGGLKDILDKGQIRSVLNEEKVAPGDVFFNPPGRIHALGPGILLAEIQQTSDITYRIYDWDRTGEDGKAREMHAELAYDALDYEVQQEYRTHYEPRLNASCSLVRSPWFVTHLTLLDKPLRKDYSEMDSFIIHICVEGAYDLVYEHGKTRVGTGEVVLLPNTLKVFGLHPLPVARILEVHIH